MTARSTLARVRRGIVLTLTLGGALGLSAVATAQSRQTQVMVMDDGAGPMVLHFSGPDVRALKEPDFLLSDLATFRDELRLADVQSDTVRARLEEYIEAFMALAQEKLPEIDPMAFHEDGQERVAGAGDPMGEPMGNMVFELGGPEGLGGLDIDMDGQGQVMIAIEASGGMGGGDFVIDPENAGGVGVDVEIDDGPAAEVVISVDSPDGEELPEEVRKKLEEEAQKIAEKIRERMESGEIDLAGPIDGPGGGVERMERQQQHFDRIAELAKEFEEAKEKLRREFVTDVQSNLEDPQLERWPNLDRALTRIKTLPEGRLDGERTDLLAVLEEVAPGVKSSGEFAEQREAYEVTLHDALVRRNAFLEDADRKVNEAMKKGDPEKALSVLDRATQLRLGVRATNERFASTFGETLGGEAAGEFQRRVLEVSYPRVYRKNTGLRAYEEARRLDGLMEETLLRILDLESPYRNELELVNAKLKRTIDQYQPLEARRGMEHMRSIMDGAMDGGTPGMAGDDDPIRGAFGERRDLDERYMKLLYELLTPEQVATLPKLPSKRQRGPIMIRRSGQEPY